MYNDNKINDMFINYLTCISNIILLVVNDYSFEDIQYINKIKNKISSSNKLFIIHNLKDKETIKFLKDKIESAKLFIEAYNNRMQTLNTFVQEIIAYQEEYFQEGDVMSLRPMKYEDIKQRTGFSESTLSRLANDKYMQTHFGTFKIRKLFTKSIENQSGESVSSDSVRNIIIELIQNEDPLLPLKDQEIENILNEKGFSLSSAR